MEKIVFNNNCYVTLQGDTALTLISDDISSRATYHVVGFNNPSVTIYDYRLSSLQLLGEILSTGNIKEFPLSFNQPALLQVLELPNGSIVMELSDSLVERPEYMFWVAIGINSPIPVYDYRYLLFDQMGEEKYALMAIYKRSNNNDYKMPRHHLSDLAR